MSVSNGKGEQVSSSDDHDRPAVAERLTVALIAEASKALAKVQHDTGLKKVDVVNRAIVIYQFINAALRDEKQIVLRDKEGREQLVTLFFL